MTAKALFDELAREEAASDIIAARWYFVTAACLAACSAGRDVSSLYQLTVQELDLKEKIIVQQRIKEAVLKTMFLYGVPKGLQALIPLYQSCPDDEIGDISVRFDEKNSDEARKVNEERGRWYFDTLWTPSTAQGLRDLLFKHHRDMYFIGQEFAFEWVIPESAILSPLETQLCLTAALICSGNPVQVVWHTRGILRFGGTIEDARFAHTLALRIAKYYGVDTKDVKDVAEIDYDNIELPTFS